MTAAASTIQLAVAPRFDLIERNTEILRAWPGPRALRLTNIHSLAVVLPNHAGDDLYRYEDRPASKAEGVLCRLVVTGRTAMRRVPARPAAEAA